VNSVSPLVIRAAALQDEAELLRMMRNLAEQEPGIIQSGEPAATQDTRMTIDS